VRSLTPRIVAAAGASGYFSRMKTILLAALVIGCGHDGTTRAPAAASGADEPTLAHAQPLTVTSHEFTEGAAIPVAYTCDGNDVAPSLAWSGAPPATKSFALVVDDPDAPDPAKPERIWVHWVVANLPATTTSLDVGGNVPVGAVVGNNDWNKPEWRGPCPPTGRHRYRFKVYALDAAVGTAGITKAQLVAAMSGHVLAHGMLTGTYQKQ
jgi:hypothetical protein